MLDRITATLDVAGARALAGALGNVMQEHAEAMDRPLPTRAKHYHESVFVAAESVRAQLLEQVRALEAACAKDVRDYTTAAAARLGVAR